MAGELRPGEWVADNVLNSLGTGTVTAPQAPGNNMVSPITEAAALPGLMQGVTGIPKAPQEAIQQSINHENISFGEMVPSMGNWGESRRFLSPPAGPRDTPQPGYRYPALRSPALDPRKQQSTATPAPEYPQLQRAGTLVPEELAYKTPSSVRMYAAGPSAEYSRQAIIATNNQFEAASSAARTMATYGPSVASFPNSIISKGTRLTEADFKKPACYRCRFVHKGGSCESCCIGCGTENPASHYLFCPIKNAETNMRRLEVNTRREGKSIQRSVKTETTKMGGRCLPKHPSQNQASPTMQLSLECQRRGFNPEFKYRERFENEGYRADLYIKGVLISGRNISYHSQKQARNALAKEGLEVVRKMFPMKDVESLGRAPPVKDEPMSVVQKRVTAISRQPTAMAPPTRIRPNVSSVALASNVRTPGKIAANRPGNPHGPTKGNWSSAARDGFAQGQRFDCPKLVASSEVMDIDLPGHIECHSVNEVLKKAIPDGTSVISINLPANVSVEVAKAYGVGLSLVIQPPKAFQPIESSRHLRSRSRSPVREQSTSVRDARERDYYRGRGHLPSRATHDAHRPPFSSRLHVAPHLGPNFRRELPRRDLMPREIIDNSRFRLSQSEHQKYQPHGRDSRNVPGPRGRGQYR